MGLRGEKGAGHLREKVYLHWLCSAPFLGAVSIRKIGEAAGNFQNAYYIEGTELKDRGIFRSEQKAKEYDGWKGEFSRTEEVYEGLQEQGTRFLTPLDGEYPKRLLHMYDYPMGLYVKGELPAEDHPTAAIIGARNCTAYGQQAAKYIGRELAESGVQIISGLALGIDGAGHAGALEGGGKTFGVLGCGVNICYPRTNYTLYDRMLSQGGLLSEYPPGTAPIPQNFPVRNRIISGLSDVILVIEAKKKSGSLITVEMGLEQGKEIFAMPGRISDALSEGCNSLIQAGANILTCPSDVLNYLGIFHKKGENPCEKAEKGLAKIEKMVYSVLDSEPRHLEEIASRSGLSVSQSMNALMELELGGYAVRTAGLYYIRGIR
ncbi:DNA-processing protein DprA [Lacrimispora sp. 210928-DFI.3.58]|uniref:DNA-processing protein DprA n=1 Tax=Lacrimispora sp. 210928-DFI.3.58 TaxID=2883214 RepID=UPI0015B5CEEF|nr:DNA-processing protein DprA [Lacrimispora sp. 210928-DFI.3.58]MCB7319886.1 DNA-processing protein DprA [Lacrimispora sp. 210928-DFI.3.58]